MLHKTRLSNGLQLMVIPQDGTQAVTVLVLVRVGSRDETARTSGISHYLEHMMFKGTNKRPETMAIARELDSVGAQYNAFTSKDHTGYYVKIDARHLLLAVDVVSDILFHSLLTSEEVERERTVIHEEINMYEDNPMMSSSDVFEETLFGPNHVLGRLISGTHGTVQGLTPNDLRLHWNRYYHPKNIVAVVAGAVEKGTMKHLESAFAQKNGHPMHQRIRPTLRTFTPKVSQHIRIKTKETQQVHVVLGVPAFSLFDRKKRAALQLFNTVMGGNMSSRLFYSVRERRGLAYYIHSGIEAYEDTGAWSIQAGLELSRIEDALNVIREELSIVVDKGISEEELKRAKDYCIGQSTLSLEDCQTRAGWYGLSQLLLGQTHTPDEQFLLLRSISLNEVNAVIRSCLNNQRLRLAIIGPFKNVDMKRFEKYCQL